MKLIISILVALNLQTAFAADSKEAAHGNDQKSEGHESGKAHKDWNEVFKQPERNLGKGTLPEATQIVEPSFLSQIKGTEVTLKWKQVEGVKYHLQVATDPNYKWLVVNEPLVTYTEYALKNLQPSQQYFWRVYTQKPDNASAWTKSSAVSSAFETSAQ